jgi:acetyl coenzyme A synthetase (ADP forming)-like protein
MTEVISDILEKASQEGRNYLYEHEGKDLLSTRGLPVARSILARSRKEAVEAARRLGYPVVLKVVSPDVLHKSDVGGVILSIGRDDEVEAGYRSILARVKSYLPDAEILGVLVQEMAPRSTEVIIGATRDPQFGPTLMFGLGGILTEVFRDVTFRVAPIAESEAGEMIREFKAHRILEGAREMPVADVQALKEILLEVSELMLECPEIQAIDLNPVLVYEEGARIVDVRVILAEGVPDAMETGTESGDLRSLFEPGSVAVIGASSSPDKIGHKILRNIVEAGFEGRVYPVNPRGGEILGLRAYPSVLDIPGEVEASVIVVPAQFVPSVVGECVRKGVRGVVIISSGFRDVGPEGAELERKVVDEAGRGGLRIIGPNCQGLSNPMNGFCATWPIVKEVGSVAVISQSGSIALEVPTFLALNRLGYSKSVALGNKADVDEADLIFWFASDEGTGVVAVYTEGMRDGRKLMRAIRVASVRKPVLVLKGGKTEAGKMAVLAHTGSLAGSREVFEAAVRQSGGIYVRGLEELCDAAKAFSALPTPRGNRLLILTSSGGAGILSTDACEELGLTLSSLSGPTIERLSATLPEYCILGNPLDLTGNAYSNPGMYRDALEIALEDGSVDMVLVVFGDPIPDSFEVIEGKVAKAKDLGIPVAANYLGGADVQEAEIDCLQRGGVPVFPTPERAIRALSYMYTYSLNLSRLKGGA